MMKRQIPVVPNDPERRVFDEAVKENIEVITGMRGGRIKTLPSYASAAEVLDKVNEILARLQ